MTFSPELFVNGTTPALNATKLNRMIGKTTVVRRASATENITNNTLTNATWDTEVQDDLSAFDIGTPDRITVAQDGVYMVAAHCAWDTSVTGDRYMHLERIRVSDGQQEVLDADGVKATIVSEHQSKCFALVALLNGDAVRVKLFQNSGATRTWGGHGRTTGNPVGSSTVDEFTVTQLGG